MFKTSCSLAAILINTLAAQPVEKGKFLLHKFAHAIGEENFETTRDGDSLVTHSHFLFTDRGGKVPLEATLRTGPTSHRNISISKAKPPGW